MLIAFLKFLFWFLFFSYLIKILLRLLAPILMRRFANKMQDRFQQFNQQYENQTKSSHDEGKVTIEKANNLTNEKSDDLGEYIDFEEVDEK